MGRIVLLLLTSFTLVRCGATVSNDPAVLVIGTSKADAMVQSVFEKALESADTITTLTIDLNTDTTLQFQIPEEISALKKLTNLKILGSVIELSSNFSELKNLESLYLWGVIPSDKHEEWAKIGELTQLKSLTITQNPEFRSFPESLKKLTNLEALSIHYNTHDMDWQKALSEIATMKNLVKLGLGPYNEIGDLPEDIAKLSKLEELDLSMTATTSIPDNISELRKLTRLDLRHTSMENIPVQLYQLQSLKFLGLPDKLISGKRDAGSMDSLLNYYQEKFPECEIVVKRQ